MEKHIIGITGGVGSGKSQVLDILREDYSAQVFRADDIAKELMEPGQEGFYQVRLLLGETIIQLDGTIDREAMARLIFRDEEKRQAVNRLIHPMVWKALKEQVEKAAGPLVAVECALPEKEFRGICDEIWYVNTSREKRLERLAQSRGYSKERSENMMDSQASDLEYKGLAQHVIDNSGSLEDTRAQIKKLMEKDDKTNENG